MSLSVMIPTKDRVSSIERAINSLKQQSVPIGELVVADAGSTDGTLELLNRLKLENNFPIKIVSGDRRLNNYLVGIEHCKYGDVLLLSDDDIVHPALNENFQKLKLSYPHAALYCFRQCVAYPNDVPTKSTVTARKWTEGHFTGSDAEKQLIENGFPGFPSLIINKKVIPLDDDNLSFFRETDYFCDLFLCSDAIASGGIAFSNYIASTFYFQKDSQSVTGGLQLFFPYWKIKILDLIQRNQFDLADYFSKWHDKRLFRYIMFSIGNLPDKDLPNLLLALEAGKAHLDDKTKFYFYKMLLKNKFFKLIIRLAYKIKRSNR